MTTATIPLIEVTRDGRAAKGNPKTDRRVFTYSRTPGATCPGASEFCLDTCYALKAYRQYKQTRAAWDWNADSRIPDLSGIRDGRILRIHVSGDFDTVEYVEAWTEALRARPGITAWAYTHSWRVPEIREALEGLRALTNVQVFASMDPTVPETPPEGWRVAWLMAKDLDYSEGVEPRGPICMEQTGAQESCYTCGYCYRGKKGDIRFMEH